MAALGNSTPFPPHYPQQILGTLLLGIPPFGKGVQRRPFKPLSRHLAPQLIILDKLSQ
jgi:hypothetical protein